MSVRALLFACSSLLLACSPTPSVDPGDGVCSEWVAWEDGAVRTYRTTTPEETYEYTQTVERSDGFVLLHTDAPEADSTFTYRCDGGAVELVSTESDTDGGVVTESYDPPWMVWPADEPTDGLSWVSISTVASRLEGSVSVTVEQQRTGEWTLDDVNVEATTDEGAVWPNSVVYTHAMTLRQDGAVIVETDELGITSLDGPGLVWNDVLTTTTTGTAESFTELLSVQQ